MMLKKPRLKRLFFILFQAAVANAENSIIHLSLILVNSFYLFMYSVNLKVSCPAGKTTRGLCPNRAKLKLSYYMQPYYSFNILTYFKFSSLTLSKFSFPIYKIELDQFTKSKFFKSSIRYSPEISKSSKANLKGCISYNFFINCKRYSNNSFGQLLFSSQFCGSI